MKSRWGAPIGALLTIVCGLALKAGPSAVWGERAWYAGPAGTMPLTVRPCASVMLLIRPAALYVIVSTSPEE